MTMTFPRTVWIPEGWHQKSPRILILGESGYGDFGEYQSCGAWVAAYLKGDVTDRMYTKVANASGMGKDAFWRSVAFFNFVEHVGGGRDVRPTRELYEAAKQSLDVMLSTLQPNAVWVWGKEQGKYSAEVIARHGIAFEIVAHPSGFFPGGFYDVVGASWKRLHSIAVQSLNDQVRADR